jgi:hypothetical protein
MKGNEYIDQSLAEFIPPFIKDRKKDMADLKELLERNSFDWIIDILGTIRETANTFGFKNLTSMSSRALTAAKNRDSEGIVELIRKMEKNLEKMKIVYVNYDEEGEMDFFGQGEDEF